MKKFNTLKTLTLAAVLFTVSATNAFSQTPTERTKTMTNQITKADEAQSFDEYEAIEKAIQIYIDGAIAGDGALIRKAFYDHAYIVGSVNGELDAANLDAFEEGVNTVGAAKDLQHRIVSIDISGPAASAKVEFLNWAGFRFTDFFVLYKHDGQWKISGKTYNSHSNN